MKTILDNLNWRYATKKFDPSKHISSEQLETLLDVLQLTPSSYGLQPYKFLIIENKEIREQLKEKSWGQSQITDASHLIVLCSYTDLQDYHVDKHIQNTADTRNISTDSLTGYGDFVKRTINNLTSAAKFEWNKKQVYIALGLLLDACAHMRIDATPMEGFDANGYDEVLHLKEKNLHATVVCPIGYRSEEDQLQFLKKVRKPKQELIEYIH